MNGKSVCFNGFLLLQLLLLSQKEVKSLGFFSSCIFTSCDNVTYDSRSHPGMTVQLYYHFYNCMPILAPSSWKTIVNWYFHMYAVDIEATVSTLLGFFLNSSDEKSAGLCLQDKETRRESERRRLCVVTSWIVGTLPTGHPGAPGSQKYPKITATILPLYTQAHSRQMKRYYVWL